MWIYDGENWVDESADSESESTRDEREQLHPIEDAMRPELQIVEITPLTPLREHVPPLALWKRDRRSSSH